MRFPRILLAAFSAAVVVAEGARGASVICRFVGAEVVMLVPPGEAGNPVRFMPSWVPTAQEKAPFLK